MAVFSNLGAINLGEWNLGDNTVAGVAQDLAGVSAGTSTTAAALQVARRLAGVAAGTALVAGALSVGAGLRGTSAGVSTCQGTLSVARALAGGSAGVATVSGTLTILTTLHIYGTAPAAGALRVFETPAEATASGSRVFAGTSAGTPRIFR